MSKFIPGKGNLREMLIHYFIMKITPVVSYRIIFETYDEHVSSQNTCERCDDFSVKDKERSGRSFKF